MFLMGRLHLEFVKTLETLMDSSDKPVVAGWVVLSASK